MSVTLGISLIVLLDAVLIAGLAFAMSAPRKLRPHGVARKATAVESVELTVEALAPGREVPRPPLYARAEAA